MGCRNDADGEVELLVADGDLDAAVLGATPLGDVHLRKDFYAGNYGAEETAGRAIALVQDAVDPVANAHDLFERLDVDVRRPKLYRLGDHELNEANDRGAVFIDDFRRTHRSGGRLRFGEIDLCISKLLEHGVGRFTFDLAVVLVDRFEDLVARGQGNFDSPIEDKSQFFHGIDVIRIADDDLQGVVFLGERK